MPYDLSTYEGRQRARDENPGWIVDEYGMYNPNTGSEVNPSGQEVRNTGRAYEEPRAADRPRSRPLPAAPLPPLGAARLLGDDFIGSDTARFSQQSPETLAAFRATYGNQAAQFWGAEHQRNLGTQGAVPQAGVPAAPVPGAPLRPVASSAIPAPGITSSAGDFYHTRTGVKHINVIREELRLAGYPEWSSADDQTILGVYARVGAQAATPTAPTAPATTSAAPNAPTAPVPGQVAPTTAGGAQAQTTAGGRQRYAVPTPMGTVLQGDFTPEEWAQLNTYFTRVANDLKEARQFTQGLQQGKFDLEKALQQAQIAAQNTMLQYRDRELAMQAANQAMVQEFERQRIELLKVQQINQLGVERERLDIQRRQVRPRRRASVRYG